MLVETPRPASPGAGWTTPPCPRSRPPSPRTLLRPRPRQNRKRLPPEPPPPVMLKAPWWTADSRADASPWPWPLLSHVAGSRPARAASSSQSYLKSRRRLRRRWTSSRRSTSRSPNRKWSLNRSFRARCVPAQAPRRVKRKSSCGWEGHRSPPLAVPYLSSGHRSRQLCACKTPRVWTFRIESASK